MASLRAIRGRIKSVKGTEKITKAMKMVAASKLRRAQDACLRARPYAQQMGQMLARLSAESEPPHLLLQPRPVHSVEVLLLTSDRGLCGGFNSNVVRALQRFLVDHREEYRKISVSTIGRRGRDFARKRGIAIRKDYPGVLGHLQYAQAQAVANDLVAQFASGEVDAVFLLYNAFQSALVQRVTLVPLLPIGVPPRGEPSSASTVGGPGAPPPAHPGPVLKTNFLYEPSKEELLAALLPKHLGVQIWQTMLESEASEHGARMTAMESATKNANEMIARLTLQYNRARQAAITKELMEIVSGAEALR